MSERTHWAIIAPLYVTIAAIIVHFGYFYAIDNRLLSLFSVSDATDSVGRFILIYFLNASVFIGINLLISMYARGREAHRVLVQAKLNSDETAEFRESNASTTQRYNPVNRILKRVVSSLTALLISWAVVHTLIALALFPFKLILGIHVYDQTLTLIMMSFVTLVASFIVMIIYSIIYFVCIFLKILPSHSGVFFHAMVPISRSLTALSLIAVIFVFGASVGFSDFRSLISQSASCAEINSADNVPGGCVIKAGSRGILYVEKSEADVSGVFIPYGSEKIVRYNLPNKTPERWAEVGWFNRIDSGIAAVVRTSPPMLLWRWVTSGLFRTAGLSNEPDL